LARLLRQCRIPQNLVCHTVKKLPVQPDLVAKRSLIEDLGHFHAPPGTCRNYLLDAQPGVPFPKKLKSTDAPILTPQNARAKKERTSEPEEPFTHASKDTLGML